MPHVQTNRSRRAHAQHAIKYIIATVIIGFLLLYPTVLASVTLGPVHGPEQLKLETSDDMFDFYFGDKSPVMRAIARCESEYRQFRPDGSPVASKTNDWGISQINATTWDSEAKRLKYDYKHSELDNVKMARHVYDQQGFEAWTTYRNGCYLSHMP